MALIYVFKMDKNVWVLNFFLGIPKGTLSPWNPYRDIAPGPYWGLRPQTPGSHYTLSSRQRSTSTDIKIRTP